MVEEYDVIVVGSGPGGAMTAKKLAEKGINTLLIERKELPRPKICGGFVTNRITKIIKKECGDIPLILCGRPRKLKGLQVKLLDREDFITFNDEMYNVWRSRFDFWLTMKAFDAGATILSSTLLIDFNIIRDRNEEFVEITTRCKSETGAEYQLSKFRSKILVGADGCTSFVRKRSYPKFQPDYSLTSQEYWTGTSDLDPNYFYALMNPSLSDLYTSFHRKDYLLIATTSRNPKNIKPLMMKCYEYFEEAHGLKREKMIFKEACLTNLSGLKLDYRFGKGRIALIGDAAGLIDFGGEGIPSAIKSGLTCAETISTIDLENPDDFQDKYQENLRKLLRSLRRNITATSSLYGNI
ncbi:MAG: NAD(P)/FAD-dependent oxidoreductase [Candidatus Helarchaeota archaeon]|nr:NAD(P)/FAD-dependent oxidoreductase [Candidatus Helarchaeota archaeon]